MIFPPHLPLQYYFCIITVLVLGMRAWSLSKQGLGIPMVAVLATVTAWYLTEPFLIEYEEYVRLFGLDALNNAWWEVLLFLISFGVLVPVMNRKINGDLDPRSQIFQMMSNLTIDTDFFQDQVTLIARLLVIPWILLMALALIRTDFDITGMFFPYLGEKATPWARGRMGGGIDALYSLATYVQIMLTALFGVAFALSKRSGTITLAGIIYLLSLPFFLFDRTRNSMLAVMIPGFLAFFSLRLRGGIIVRLLVLIVAFTTVDQWMKIVIASRGAKISVAEQISKLSSSDDSDQPASVDITKKKHQGMNMFQELGYCNYFIANGTYKPNWGARYFAEIVNPIPRAIWPGKPLIGIDWAIARGYGDTHANADATGAGVVASIATGMIGQGVVNFGRFLGPIASALLMAIWVAVLARQDLMGHDIGHLLLYAIGLVLTFNMGREITVLVLYPFIFGWLLLWWNNRRIRSSG